MNEDREHLPTSDCWCNPEVEYVPPLVESNEVAMTNEQPAAHEAAGILRMQRAGMSGPKIGNVLGLSKEQFFHEVQMALDDETEAHRQGIPTYDDRIIVCSQCGDAMERLPGTTIFKCHVDNLTSFARTEH